MSVAVIERKGDLYTVTIVGDFRPVVKSYYTQQGIRNAMRGRGLDLIILKNVELTEETKRELDPCLVHSNGKYVEVPA